MTAFWVILAPFMAIAIICLAAWTAVGVTDAIRRHDYRLFEDKSAPILAEDFPLPDVASSGAEARRKSLSPLVAKVHQKGQAPPRPSITAGPTSRATTRLSWLPDLMIQKV